MARVDYDEMAGRYDEGRAVPIAALEPWRVALDPYVTARDTVLDLGAGTGIFSEAIAHWFGARVIGVEPSSSMRSQAIAQRRRAGVSYLAGRAEQLPIRQGSCQVAWLSTVIHHFESLPESARELSRALTPDATLLVRSAFPGRLDHMTLFRYFPEAREVAESFPTVEMTTDAFASEGFDVVTLQRVNQQWAPSLRAYVERVRLRADTTLSIAD